MLIITVQQPTGNKTSFFYYNVAKNLVDGFIRALEHKGLTLLSASYHE